MKYIYKYQNKINGKIYIGQTNDIRKRKNGHKSAAYNLKSKDYNAPFHNAIRKYGIDNFSFEILEAISDNEIQNYVDEREKYYIEKYQSLISFNGYNVSQGGQGFSPIKKTYEQCIKSSRIFSPEEIEDIQQSLINNISFNAIIKKYSPRLTRTYLSNINCGINLKNPKLNYPLQNGNQFRSHFSPQEILEIKNRIKKGEIYRTIREDFDIKSDGFLSGINSGKYFYDKNETYPLFIKGCNKKANEVWVNQIINDLLNTDLTQNEIAQKYNKARSTVTKINNGRAHKKENLTYPLRKK